MSNTANLQMPLVQAAQAQKHVTVNEALSLLDAVAQLTLQSLTVSSPPGGAVDGQGYGVPEGADGAWSGQAGLVAIFSNGGWRFVAPQAGWRAFVQDEARPYLYDGTAWLCDAVTLSPNGAGMRLEVLEFDHDITPGLTQSTAEVIPPYSLVFGVTGRVTQNLNGFFGSWDLGVVEHPTRYGAKLKKPAGEWLYGLSRAPMAYFAPTPLMLSTRGGSFSGGQVRLAIHLMRFALPRL